MSVDVKYKTRSTATGGRDGHSKSEDGPLDVKLVTPKELGGAGGDGVNPEQLFATGYAACFLGAMRFVGSQKKVKIADDARVTAEVGMGPRDAGGFGVAIHLTVDLPGMDDDQAREIVEAAHKICPYSNAMRGNVDIGLTVA